MPIPAAPPGRGPAQAVLALFHQLHQQLRDELTGFDDDAINWVPAPGANSIATIVTHLIGSEAETLRSVAGVECERDRDAEFVGRRLTVGEVIGLLGAADSLATDLAPLVDSKRLDATFPLPTLPAEEIRPGLTWLVGNYGHAREHVGHVQLTKQLWQQAGPAPS